jgi:flavin-dependent dehydrogenase
MAIAMHSGRLAAETYLAHGRAASLYHERLRRDVGGGVRLAAALQRAARFAPVRPALVAGGRLWPGTLRAIAELTRVPAAARFA